MAFMMKNVPLYGLVLFVWVDENPGKSRDKNQLRLIWDRNRNSEKIITRRRMGQI